MKSQEKTNIKSEDFEFGTWAPSLFGAFNFHLASSKLPGVNVGRIPQDIILSSCCAEAKLVFLRTSATPSLAKFSLCSI